MTQTGYSNAVVNAMLGWLKGLATWVLRLFNLSGGGSPLKFLADNWLKLLIICLIIGVVMDRLVWILRWRPHWVWFHKKRVIINDKNFFADENDTTGGKGVRKGNRPMRPAQAWEDSEYVVRGQVNRERERRRREAQQARNREGVSKDVFRDDMFNVNVKQKYSDKYEDEVFNLSNLPKPAKEISQRRRSGRK